jgi:hypothetical protein
MAFYPGTPTISGSIITGIIVSLEDAPTIEVLGSVIYIFYPPIIGEETDEENNTDGTDYLIYDANDDRFVYDTNDNFFLRDGNEPIIVPPIAGLIDAVGGPIGGPVGERVILVDTHEAEGAGLIPAEWLAIANHPIMGRMLNAPPLTLPPLNLRLADRDFTTRYNDPDEPSRYWDGRVLDPGAIAMTMPLVPSGEGAIETRFGTIAISNNDRAFDTVLDVNQVISQPIRVRIGTIDGYLEDFETICVARIVGVGMTSDELTLEIRDPATYAQNLYPTSVYSGLGAATGTADLSGMIKPVVLGRVWNMSPVLIDPVLLIYQAHDGELGAVTGVFDGGAALTFQLDYETYALLAAATVTAG